MYLLQHQMVTTLAISLLVLCSALLDVQNLVSLDLRQWELMENGEFDAAIELLGILAQKVPLAQRVLSDFDQVVPIVRSMLSRWPEGHPSFEVTSDGNALNDIIPLNAAELLPYGNLYPDIRFPRSNNGSMAANESIPATDSGLSSWNTHLKPGSARSSVLWL